MSLPFSPPSPLLPSTWTRKDKSQGKAEIVRKDHDKPEEMRRRTAERRARGRSAMTLLSRTWIRSRLSLSTEWKWRTPLLASSEVAREERRDKAWASFLISRDFNKTHSCPTRFTSALGLCLLIHVFPPSLSLELRRNLLVPCNQIKFYSFRDANLWERWTVVDKK